jgi:photosystem II stability/assembly factor-like uncharacterized protein
MTVPRRGGLPWWTINATVLLSTWALLMSTAGSASAEVTTPGGPLATWTRTGGPTNVTTLALAIDPVATTIVYRGGPDGVYKSTDGGVTWRKTGALAAQVQALVIDPSDPQTVYAGTYGEGVWRSKNGGVTWSQTGHMSSRYVWAIAIDPLETQTVYTANDAYVYKSTNGGRTWIKASSGVPLDKMQALALDPADPETIYVGTNNTQSDGHGVYKTTDGGATWLPANGGEMGSLRVLALAIDPLDPETLYAGTYERLEGQGGVLKTTDGGTTWTRLSSWGTVNTLAIDPARPATVYAGPAGLGIFKTGNGGDIWQQVNDGLTVPWVNAIAIDPSRTTKLFAGTSNAVFMSARGGVTWQLSTALALFGSAAIAADPTAPGTIYASAFGVLKSTDGGRTWTDASVGLSTLGSVTALTLDPSDPLTLYAGTSLGEMFRTTDGGISWAPLNGSLPLTPIAVVAIDPSAPSTIYAGGNSGVVKSTDRGNTWIDASDGLVGFLDVTALLIDPTDPAVVYAGLSYDDGENSAGVYKSGDAGATWSRSSTGFSGYDTSVYGLAIDPRDHSTIYAAAGCGGHGEEVECYMSTVYRTSDAADHWDDLLTVEDNWMSSVVIDPADPQTLFAGSTGYADPVSRSSDAGQSWTPFADGLGDSYVFALVFDGSGALYAATSDGVFKSQP